MRKTMTLIGLLVLGTAATKAQVKFGDNKSSIDAASLVELESTNKGLLIPRVALTATNSWGLITTGSTKPLGMLVYNTSSSITAGTGTNGRLYPTLPAKTGVYYWDQNGWVGMATDLDSTKADPFFWKTKGNAGTTSATSFVGTTDDADLVFRTNNTERMRIDSATGNVGIGTTNPGKKLEVNAASDYLKVTNLKIMPSTGATNQIVIDTTTGELGRSLAKAVAYITKVTSPINSSTPTNSVTTIGNLSVRINNDGSTSPLGGQMGSSQKNIELQIATTDHVAIWSEVAGTGGTGFGNYEFNSPLTAATWHAVNINTTVNNKDFFRMLVSLYSTREIYRVTVQMNNALSSPAVPSGATIFIEQIK